MHKCRIAYQSILNVLIHLFIALLRAKDKLTALIYSGMGPANYYICRPFFRDLLPKKHARQAFLFCTPLHRPYIFLKPAEQNITFLTALHVLLDAPGSMLRHIGNRGLPFNFLGAKRIRVDKGLLKNASPLIVQT